FLHLPRAKLVLRQRTLAMANCATVRTPTRRNSCVARRGLHYRLVRMRRHRPEQYRGTSRPGNGDPLTTQSSSGRPERVRVIRDGLAAYLPDIDPDETGEWLESFDQMVRSGGQQRADRKSV